MWEVCKKVFCHGATFPDIFSHVDPQTLTHLFSPERAPYIQTSLLHKGTLHLPCIHFLKSICWSITALSFPPHLSYSSHVVWWLDAELLLVLLCVFRLDVLHVHFRQGPPSACNVGPEVPLVLVTQGPLFFLLLLPSSSLVCESPFPVGDVEFERNIAGENWCIALANAAV